MGMKPPSGAVTFLEAVAAELQAQPTVGPGNAHRIAFAVAKRLAGS
jgi:recombinational DNA repair protein RecR